MGLYDLVTRVPTGSYPRGDGSEITTFRPSNTNYNVTTGLLVANPFLMGCEGGEFGARWDAFKERATTWDGWRETFGLSIGINAGMKVAMPAILFGLTRQPVWSLLGRAGLGSANAVRGISTMLLSGVVSGGLTLYQRHQDPRMRQESFLQQWLRSLAYSLPSSYLGMHAMQRWGFGATLLQDTAMEGIQAGLSVGVGYGLEACGVVPASSMNIGERLAIEFCEGALFMATGRGVGAGIDVVQQYHQSGGMSLAEIPGLVRGCIVQLAPATGPSGERMPGVYLAVGKGEGGRRGLEVAASEPPKRKPTALIFLGKDGIIGRMTPEGRWEHDLTQVELGLPEGVTRLADEYFDVSGDEAWRPDALYPLVPTAGGLGISDGMQQVHGYYFLRRIVDRLRGTGIDLAAINRAYRGGSRPLPVRVNAKEVVKNAYFRPAPGTEAAFGPFVVMDPDVPWHEIGGHFFLDRLNPLFLLNSQLKLGEEDMFADGHRGSQGGAIHEGTADAMAAIAKGDPRMARYLVRLIDPRMGDALRNLKNDLKISDIPGGEDGEPHFLGQVYGGFWWSLFEGVLSKPGTTPEAVQNYLLGLAEAHIACYSTMRPTAGHFVEAVGRAALSLEVAGMTPQGITVEEVLGMIRREGARREFLKEGEKPAGPPVKHDFGSRFNARVDQDIRVAMKRYAAKFKLLRFNHVVRLPIPGGEVSYWRQMYPSVRVRGEPNRVPVEVVGHVMVQWYDKNGHATEVARGDVRRIKTGEIDETVDVEFGDALAAAKRHLLRLLHDIEGSDGEVARGVVVGKKESPKPRSREDELRLQQYRMMEQAFAKAEKEYPRKLAILGGSKHLYWEINLGFANFYIPAEQTAFRQRPDGYFHSRVLSDCWRQPKRHG